MDIKITHIPEQNRFQTEQDGYLAHVDYRIMDGKLIIQHTIVPRPISGKGVASELVREAYDYALANGLKARATCPYAVVWLKRHPEYLEETNQ